MFYESTLSLMDPCVVPVLTYLKFNKKSLIRDSLIDCTISSRVTIYLSEHKKTPLQPNGIS